MLKVVEDLVDAAQAEQFFASADAAYRRLREDPGTWHAELEDREAWESTVADGLGDV